MVPIRGASWQSPVSPGWTDVWPGFSCPTRERLACGSSHLVSCSRAQWSGAHQKQFCPQMQDVRSAAWSPLERQRRRAPTTWPSRPRAHRACRPCSEGGRTEIRGAPDFTIQESHAFLTMKSTINCASTRSEYRLQLPDLCFLMFSIPSMLSIKQR